MVKVVGITGFPGSGKSTVSSKIASEFDSPVEISMGDIVRELASERGHETSHEIGEFAGEFRQERGIDVFAVELLDRYKQFINTSEVTIIEGIRSPEEVEQFREVFGSNFVLVGVETDPEIMYERIVERKREDENEMLWSDYQDRLERERDRFKSGESLEQADLCIDNNGSEEDLQQSIEQDVLPFI